MVRCFAERASRARGTRSATVAADVTGVLHFPHGTTLLGHTLGPLNGVLAATVLSPLSLVQAYNAVVLPAFVGTGLTASWLCHFVSRSYVGSLVGGFAFTFSSYHFAHAIGHMNLITLQWVPLFLLAWLALLRSPGYLRAALAAVALLLVALTDFYYLLFSVLAAFAVLAYFAATKRLCRRGRAPWGAYGAFVALAALLVGPLPLAVPRSHRSDPFLGAHDPLRFGNDVLVPFIPGEIWRFYDLAARG